MRTATKFYSSAIALCLLLLHLTAFGQHVNPRVISFFGWSDLPASLALSDLDNDGDMDVLTHNRFPNEPIVYAANSGNGSSFVINNIAGSDRLGSIGYLTVSDLDKNGLKDIIAVTCNSPEKNKIIVWFGLGINSFTSPVTLIQDLKASSELDNNKIHVVDMDQDGRLDILLPTMSDDYYMTWFKNSGSSSGWQQFTLNNVRGGDQSAVADLNGDGVPEIVSSSGIGVYVYYGQNWQQQKHLTYSGFENQAILISDFDKDGDLDFMVGNKKWSDGLVWFENKGNLNFTEHLINNSKGSFNSLLVDDFNQDGYPDILASCYTDCPYTYFINNGAGGFVRTTFEQYTSAVYGLYDSATGDLDGDGRNDLVVSDSREHDVRWYRNNFTTVLSIENASLSGSGVNVYPTIADQAVVISSREKALDYVSVYTMNGMQVHNMKLHTKEKELLLDFSDLREGLYLVVITLDGGATTKHKVIRR